MSAVRHRCNYVITGVGAHRKARNMDDNLEKDQGDDAIEKPWMRFFGAAKGMSAELAAIDAAIEAEFETIEEEDWELCSTQSESLASPTDDEQNQ